MVKGFKHGTDEARRITQNRVWLAEPVGRGSGTLAEQIITLPPNTGLAISGQEGVGERHSLAWNYCFLTTQAPCSSPETSGCLMSEPHFAAEPGTLWVPLMAAPLPRTWPWRMGGWRERPASSRETRACSEPLMSWSICYTRAGMQETLDSQMTIHSPFSEI